LRSATADNEELTLASKSKARVSPLKTMLQTISTLKYQQFFVVIQIHGRHIALSIALHRRSSIAPVRGAIGSAGATHRRPSATNIVTTAAHSSRALRKIKNARFRLSISPQIFGEVAARTMRSDVTSVSKLSPGELLLHVDQRQH
jgi:hypothetical protein